MNNMNSLFVSAALTLLAGAVPLVPMSSPMGTMVNTIAILIAIVGSAITLMLYFSQDEKIQAVAAPERNEVCCSR